MILSLSSKTACWRWYAALISDFHYRRSFFLQGHGIKEHIDQNTDLCRQENMKIHNARAGIGFVEYRQYTAMSGCPQS